MAKRSAGSMAHEGEYIYGVGRRKSASAQVRVYSDGADNIMVNGKTLEEYFPRAVDQRAVRGPLQAANASGYTVTCMVHGGGMTGQAGAVMQGVARCLVKADETLRVRLRRGGFLTRDPREKERKKPGLKRARKAPQYTKR